MKSRLRLRLRLLLLCGIAASSPAGGAQSVPLELPSYDGDQVAALTQSRRLQGVFDDASQGQGDITTGADGSCHLHASTRPVQNVIGGNGIVFAVQSEEDDDDGLAITGMGFHVDPTAVANAGAFDYKVYILSPSADGDGYYASPERDAFLSGMIASDADPNYDYRGEENLNLWWIEIAAGQITQANLTNDLTTLTNEDDFYAMAPGTFNEAIGPNGDIRSFYIETQQAGFRYADPPEGQTVNDEMVVVGPNDPGGHPPKVLIGEGVVGNPMPEEPLNYLPKMFVGRIYYGEECPTAAPSKSSSPSAAPTATVSDAPSFAPSVTSAPTAAPSVAESDMPSAPPTEEAVEEVSSGLIVAMPIQCNEGDGVDDVDEGTKRAMEEATQKTAADAVAKDPTVSNIRSTLAGVNCKVTITPDRHLAGHAAHRQLPTTSSAMDFSMVITGEYRPPKRRPGEPAPPPSEPPNLGELTEDSINRDPESFVKDLQDRAGEASPLQEVEASDIQVQAVEIPEGVDPTDVTFTPQPTLRPTPPPTVVQEDSSESILVICIVVVAGLIVVLGAFLLYKHGERRAAKARREKMARIEDEKAELRMERRQRAKWEEAHMPPHASVDKERWLKEGAGGAAQYPTMAYPPPPPYGAYPYPPHAPPPHAPPPQANYGAGPPQPVAPVQQYYPQGTYAYPPQPPPGMHASMQGSIMHDSHQGTA